MGGTSCDVDFLRFGLNLLLGSQVTCLVDVGGKVGLWWVASFGVS